jgi:hypothetical protein
MTAHVAESAPIRVLSLIRPRQTVEMPESYHAASLEAPVVKTQFPFTGSSSTVPASHTNPDLETGVAWRDHYEMSQSCGPTQPLASDAPPQRSMRSSASLIDDGVITNL